MRSRALFAGTAAVAICVSSAEARPVPGLRAEVWHTATCEDTNVQSGDEILGAILTALIAPLVDAGVKGVVTALSKAGAPDETRVSGSAATAFYKGVVSADQTEIALARKDPCISFAVDSTEVAARQRLPLSGDNVGPRGKAWLQSRNYTHAPRLYMESRIIVSPDRSAWRLVPVRAFVGEPLSESERGRDLVITISVLGPSAETDGSALGTRSFAIKRAYANAALSSAQLAQLATGWMPLPALSEESETRTQAIVQRYADKKALDEQLASNKLKGKQLNDAQASKARLEGLLQKDAKYLEALTPVTLKVDVLQTTDGNKALVAIGGFLNENSKAISDPIAAAVSPETRKTKREESAAAEDDARVAAIEAVETWKTGLSDPTKSPSARRIDEIRA